MSNFYWSATKINVANYCTMRYFLRYVRGVEPLRLSAYVKGLMLHNIIENFWRRLGSEDEAKSTSKKFKDKKYFDEDSFVKYVEGRWKRTVVSDKESKKKISWKYKDESWIILDNLRKISKPLYHNLMEQGPPLFAELGFDFEVNRKRFKGRIDEVRVEDGKIILRDYKSGWPRVGEMKLKHDPQLTLYNVGLVSLCKQDKKIAQKLGLEGKIEELMDGAVFVSPNIEEQFFMIEALSLDPAKVKIIPNAINKTKRTDNHFFELLKMIDGTQESVNKGIVYPERGKKCDFCDLKYACDKELGKVNKGNFTEKDGQQILSFAVPNYAKKEEINPKIKQKKIRFRYKKG